MTAPPNRNIVAARRFEPYTLIAGVVAIVIGAVVLLGWSFDISLAKNLWPGRVEMKANAAVAFVLIGLGFVFYALPRSSLHARFWRCCALLAGVIGLLTVCEYIFRWNPGFDHWLFHEAPGAVGTSHPGRMAAQTAFCFVLLSAALLAAPYRARKGRASSLAALGLSSVVSTVGLTDLLGSLTAGPGLLGWWDLTAMAVPTALVLAVLGTALGATYWRDTLPPELTPFSRKLAWSVGLILLLTIVFIRFAHAEREVDQANESRFQSYQLTNELRQSGDDLTRMVRTYVATADPIYKQHFQDILDIRDGKKPRPENDSRPYWDLVLASGLPPRASQPAISLLELMRRAGFTDEEFRKLAEAKANSDALTRYGFEAMKLVESGGPDAAANRRRAQNILYDEEYQRAKLAAMKPIDEVFSMVDKRTLTAVQSATRTASIMRYAFVGIGLVLVLTLWGTYSSLRNTLGGSLDEVGKHIARLGSGDFSTPITATRGGGDSVLGWLSATQDKLKTAAEERQLAEEARQRLAAIVESAEDAIIGKNLEGIIRSWNPAAERMFGYRADEIVGQPALRLLPEGRRVEERRILDTIRLGERVSNFESVRQRKDGSLLDVSVGVSPIKDFDGSVVGASTIVRDITERKKAEAALQKSETLLAQAERMGNVGGWEVDLETGEVSWTRMVFEIHEVDPALKPTLEEAVSFYTPASRPVIKRLVQRAIDSGEPFDVELEIITAKGNLRSVHSVGTADPARAKIFGFFQDITKRKEAENALRESENRFRELANSVPQLVWTCAPDGTCDFLSSQWVAFTGIPEEPQLGFGWLEQLHPDDRDPTIAAWEAACESEEDFRTEFRIRRHDGDYRWFDTRALRVKDPDGKIIKWVGSNTDITERKQSEAALKGIEWMLTKQPNVARAGTTEIAGQPYGDLTVLNTERTILDAVGKDLLHDIVSDYMNLLETSSAVYEKNGDYAYGIFASGWCQTMDFASFRGCGTTDRREALNCGKWHCHDSCWNEASRKSMEIDGPTDIECKGGIRLYAVPIHAGKEIVGSINFGYGEPPRDPARLQDLAMKYGLPVEELERHGADYQTRPPFIIEIAKERLLGSARLIGEVVQRHRAEKQVQRLNAELEQRVANRTTQLQAANKELEAFSYSVSHDLRAPLRHINGFSQALLEDYEDKLDESGKQYLRELRGASQQMAQLIDDVLQLARVTRSEMRNEAVNLSEVARTAIDNLRKTDTARDVIVEIEDGLVVEGDPRLLQIMITNLVDNAWKFTSKRAQAAISIRRERRNGDSTYFVQDNGAGFDMAYVDKLFGAFQRLHSTNEFEGTGIGLATVQRIINRHGGQAWAEGKVNDGATFYFTIPNLKESGNGGENDFTRGRQPEGRSAHAASLAEEQHHQ